MSKFAKIVPLTQFEKERFFLDVIEKLKNTDLNLADIEEMLGVSAIGYLSEVSRTIDQIARMVSTMQSENHELKRRIDAIERSI